MIPWQNNTLRWENPLGSTPVRGILMQQAAIQDVKMSWRARVRASSNRTGNPINHHHPSLLASKRRHIPALRRQNRLLLLHMSNVAAFIIHT